jgi:hypothetical protein
MAIIPPGNTVELTGTFTDPDTGALVDPATVKLTLRQAGQDAVVYVYGTDAITRESQGVYTFLVDPPDPATTWFYRWEGDDATYSAADEVFQIGRSLVG